MSVTIQEPQTSKTTEEEPVSPDVDHQLCASVNRDEESRNPVQPLPAMPPAGTRPPSQPKTMDRGRFFFGMLLSSVGIGLLLLVAVGTLQQMGADGRLSLPLVAITSIAGVMMLGGGFGVMATAAAGLDDGEFDRLMKAGNISSVCDEPSASGDKSPDAEQRPDVPAGRGSEQRNADEV